MAQRIVFEIPLQPSTAQQFYIPLNGINYRLRFLYINAPEGGWIMDIADGPTDDPIVCGIPLVPGADLLAQYQYLGIGSMFIVSAGDMAAPPTFDNLGVTTKLYYAYAEAIA